MNAEMDFGDKLNAPGNTNTLLTNYPRYFCIHQLFELQVKRNPDAIAVSFKHEALTYRELNDRANQLAHYLLTLGVETETLVGIFAERSVEMVIAMLAVLKAGGAYLPIDPELPQERLQLMLNDANPLVLLTQQHLFGLLPAHPSVLCLDTQWHKVAALNKENLACTVKAEHAAYVIYTSGSTGIPKGAVCLHRSVVNLIKGDLQNCFFNKPGVFSQLSSSSFDVSIFEIWGALLSGAKLCIVEKAVALDARQLKRFLQAHQITISVFPTALFHRLANDDPGLFAGLDYVIFGGEACNPEILRNILKQNASNRLPCLINIYGPTECTVYTTFFSAASISAISTPVPIGKPIANVQVYILDQQLKRVPVNEIGEIYIAGEGLARGYLNRPELTQERFISNPYATKTEKSYGWDRLYKTGDLGRYLPDHNIEFIGRIDEQVKIRGFRIEPGEIEATLSQHNYVKEVLVIPKTLLNGDKRLVAYIVANETVAGPDYLTDLPQVLQEYLKQKLPSYMVPSAFILMPGFPLTSNGKVNKHALPEPDWDNVVSENYVAPATQIEQQLAAIWAESFGVKKISCTANFFEIGGHSLIASKIIRDVCCCWQIELNISSLYTEPTIVSLAAVIEKTVQYQHLQVPIIPLSPAERLHPLPLSLQQKELWFMSRLHPEEPLYNEPLTVYLGGNIDVEALEKSLQVFMQRHESWRTSFKLIDELPAQIIHSYLDFTLNYVDLSHLPKADSEAQAVELATTELKLPFDLAQLPLFRVILIKFNDNDYRLYWSIHHIIFDGLSYVNFLNELEQLYSALKDNRPSPLASLPIQYADFTVWQQQWRQSNASALQEQLAYWQKKLANLPVLQLPTDYPRSLQSSSNGKIVSFSFSKSLTLQLKQFSSQNRVTLFTTLFTAFNTLLYRYSGQEDIIIGTVIAGRQRPELEKLVGYFVNPLVLRSDFSGSPTFKEALIRLHETTVEAYLHQDVPFEEVVRAVNPSRAAGGVPLFNVVFTLEPALPASKLDWSISQLDFHTGVAKFDLYLELDERPTGIIGRIEYRTDLFSETTIQRIINHYQALLQTIINNAERKIAELSFLLEEEKQQLISWNQTATAFPGHLTIQQLFELQVSRTPHNVAVSCGEHSLTYLELNQKANQLAAYLRNLGIQQEMPVAVSLERSLDMVIAILGVLKAGGAYVPLDPAYPLERLQFMLADIQAPVWISHSQFAEKYAGYEGHLVNLPTDWQKILQQPAQDLLTHSSGKSLAHIIYTSGSTGKPKGVLIEHGGVIRLVKNTNYIRITEQDCMAQASTVNFDAATFEIWGALLNGARLTITPTHVLLSASLLKAFLREQKVSILFLTTTLLSQLALADHAVFSGIKYLIVGGEKLSNFATQTLRQDSLVAPQHLINLYGPTENTMASTTYTFISNHYNYREPPIGRPIANTTAYILDASLQPVSIGVIGELYVGGAGLARGYLNRPELTAEKFIDNPFITAADKQHGLNLKLYRTGDLARYFPDGNIEYLGRADQQVKLRGFRIELGEIEAVMYEDPAVQEAVVVIQTDATGDKQLVAYFTTNASVTLDKEKLRAMLKLKLPAYMVPAHFIALVRLPLTLNGKLDRNALPPPENTYIQLTTQFVACYTRTQQIVANIWQDILRLNKVSVQDSFFDLGGHSLLLPVLQARLEQYFKRAIPIMEIFKYPTIAGFADYLDGSNNTYLNSAESTGRSQQRLDALKARRSRNKQAVLEENG